jgi:hypothetical protein
VNTLDVRDSDTDRWNDGSDVRGGRLKCVSS